MKNKLYVINGKTYLSHINDEVHLYGLLHQLAFLAGRIKDEEDVFHVLDTAKRYGEIAEEKFQSWGIPGRYLVFGDPKDLKGPYGQRNWTEAHPGNPGGGAEAQEISG